MNKALVFSFSLLICGLGTNRTGAAVIDCAGVLGNSGEQGQSLVRFGDQPASGIGVAADRYGSLWDRAGAGVLNRYAADGRRLASYQIPTDAPNRQTDAIALLGDTVILRLGQGLYTLPIDAPAGASATSLNIAADLMSPSVRDGQALASKGTEVFLVNAAGTKQPIATLKKAPDGLGFGADGAICIIQDGKFHRLGGDGSEGPTPAGAIPGERSQYLNGYWYGSAWHSTIRRFDAAWQPAPGVVLGGNSGSFIGHVAEQSEVVNSRGLAQLAPGLLAVSGTGGILHLLEWKPADLRFWPIRRIGAIPSCGALALDREGRIWFKSGHWNWDDGPATPLHYGIPEPDRMCGITMQDSDALVGYGSVYGKPSLIFGKLDKEVQTTRIETTTTLPKEAVAVVISEINRKRVLLVLAKSGALTAVHIGDDGKYQGDAGPVQLLTTTPVKQWTSLAAAGRDKLLGAADGQIIELTHTGETWKESRRWNSWGSSPKDQFGPMIYLSIDADHLWVSDSMRHRIVCLSLATRQPIAQFGGLDQKGDDLPHLDCPQVLAARQRHAVVFDSGNQRLVKLTISK